MSLAPAARQRLILDRLGARRSLTIQELVAELGVSAMTIHRDLNRLAIGGQLVKTRGGAALPVQANNNANVSSPCAMCNRPVPERSAVVMQSQQRGHLAACCPHCGLALLDHDTSADLMLVTDFLDGQMVSANDASFVLGSDVSSCCTPGILAFVRRDDATRFQQGFGGEVMSLSQVRRYLRGTMSVPKQP